MLNDTHNPALQSWVASANHETTDFPIQNLPYASARRKGSAGVFQVMVAIGDFALPLASVAEQVVVDGKANEALLACAEPQLNALMALTPTHWSALRRWLSNALQRHAVEQSILEPLLLPIEQLEFQMPCRVGDYTDFYSSIYHATAVGRLFRPDNPLLPNYKWVPIGYHGRASSIDVSGQSVRRPCGQLKAPDSDAPTFGPCQRLDYEVELGAFIGQGNRLGTTIPMSQAEDHLFGLCLLNDWSARDIQAWEYQPLGPFLAKSFASTISPWVITQEALAPFRVKFERDVGEPQPLPYLSSEANQQHGAFDITLQCALKTSNGEEERLSESNFKYSYWTLAQMITHHASNGCNLQPGDLLGTGTQSGPEPEQAGSLLELTQGGKQAITLQNGEKRTFLEDGDTVIMTARCVHPNARAIGFGRVQATVLPAH